jgi:altronate hydrolase
MPYDAPKTPLYLRLNPADDVVIALREIAAGTRLDGEGVSAAEKIPPGHKMATRAKQPGEPVRRYGQIIGFASAAIAPGQHVHTHNLEMRDFARDYAFGQDVKPVTPADEPATFMGILRKDGRVATRNYIGVISTVNCSAAVSKWVAEAFKADALKEFPNIDGIVPLTHQTGCGMASTGEGIDVLRRTIAGYARHANFGGVLVIGLGCEANQMDALFFSQNLKEADLLKPLIIQQQGGAAKTVQAGIDAVRKILPMANNVKRERVPASHITVGLQCGGSDGYSGITANPALGAAVDMLTRHGGTAILSETPEIYGAEHLLTRRAVSRAVGEKLIARIKWWEDYTARNKGEMNNNPSPGNKAGGLTTILEKSLGAVAKGGTTNLVDVYEYAEKVTAKGFVYMDTPGYDPVSATGQVAGGANLICFTTGRGSVYGCKPAPSLKLATNSRIYHHMVDDMDVNCGTIVEGGATVAEKGKEIFELMLRVASGEKSKSEAQGFGADEFVPWQIGAVM